MMSILEPVWGKAGRGGADGLPGVHRRVVSHIPDKGQVTVRYYGLYGNAHRGKVRKAQPDKHPFIIVEEENPKVPHQGWPGPR